MRGTYIQPIMKHENNTLHRTTSTLVYNTCYNHADTIVIIDAGVGNTKEERDTNGVAVNKMNIRASVEHQRLDN